MSIVVKLSTKDPTCEETVLDPHELFEKLLWSEAAKRSIWLKLIDPYRDYHFNSTQLNVLEQEIRAALLEINSRPVAEQVGKVLRLIEIGKSSKSCRLSFLGD